MESRHHPRDLSIWKREALILCVLLKVGVTASFVTHSVHRNDYFARPATPRATVGRTRPLFLLEDDDFSLYNSNNSKSDDTSGWFENLRARQSELGAQEQKRAKNWRTAHCTSAVAVSLPDWVRRLDVQYPLAACGSASGTIYVVDLERGKVVATSAPTKKDRDSDEEDEKTNTNAPENLEQTLRLLYGSYDGGGTLAIAFSGTLICEAGRGGGVNLWRLGAENGKLVSQGSIAALKGVLVSCLHLGEDYLWVGTADGRVQGYPLDGDLPLALRIKPEKSWDLRSPLISMNINSELRCAVLTTASGSIEIISLDDDTSGRSVGCFVPPYDSSQRRSSNVYAMSATVLASKPDGDDITTSYSVVCGGSDGSIYLQPLAVDEDNDIDFTQPFQEGLRYMKPRHYGSLKCLASPAPGLLISAGLDGSMRVWDVDERKCLYQFVGYKVWLGSLWTDGVRIVSDGADNTVVMHDFDKEEEVTPKKSE